MQAWATKRHQQLLPNINRETKLAQVFAEKLPKNHNIDKVLREKRRTPDGPETSKVPFDVALQGVTFPHHNHSK